MTHSKIFAAAIMVIAAAASTSCKGFLEDSASYGGLKTILMEGETVVDRVADNKTISLEKDENFSFTENLYVEKADGEMEWRKGNLVTIPRYYGVKGETVDTVYTKNANFTANLISRKGAESTWQDGEWSGLQVDSTYTWVISNGEKTFNFTTVASASDAVYNGVREADFPMLNRSISAELSKTEKVTVLNGKTYKETDFVHTSNYGFAVPAGFGSDSKSIELVNKLVVLDLQANLTNTIENEDYVLNLVAEGNRAYADVQKNSWDVVVYDYDTEVSRQGNSVDLALSAEASKPAVITVKKDDLGKLSLRTLTHGANRVTKVTDGDITKTTTSLDYVATFNGGNAVTISTLAESAVRGDKSLRSAKIQNVRFVGAELSSKTDANATIALNFDVDFETPNVATKAASSVVTKTISVEQKQVARYRVPSIENGKPTVKTYEGDNLIETETFDASSSLTANSASDIYAANANFNTKVNGKSGEATANRSEGHWTVTRKTGKYTSTNSNGVKSQDNVYNFGYDEVIVYKNGDDIFTFNGTFVISEGTTSLTPNGVKDIDGIYYDVTAYSNSINAVYEINNVYGNVTVKNHEDGVAYNILVEREVPHIIPEEWGKPVSYGVSAVPAHAVSNGYADGNSNQVAHKAHCFAFEKGAVVVVTTMNTVVPNTEKIVGGYFVSGDYKGYNSGVDVNRNGRWTPARAADKGGYLTYTLKDGRVRSISNETLTTWPSWGYSYTTVVDKYSYSISESGVLTVLYNSQVVLQIR